MSDTEIETKKRKQIEQGQEELEVDVEAPVPKSKKQKRLEKKGKTEDKKKDSSTKRDDMNDLYDEESTSKAGKEQKEAVKGENGVWIGNLAFDTEQDELVRFLVHKTADDEDEARRISEDNITRVNVPRHKGSKKIKGFAYVDFASDALMQACVGLSEQNLNGRNLLIKSSKSFDGRPDPKVSKNPPSRILFVGNLSFDTTQSQLEMHFQHCGEIVKIRMATFEDSGNCKGFAFVDFLHIEAATKALADKRCKRLNGRTLRMEYGEDRSKRTKAQKSTNLSAPSSSSMSTPAAVAVEDSNSAAPHPQEKNKPRKDKFVKDNTQKRTNPGLALANAQRASAGIVQSAGKKMTFD